MILSSILPSLNIIKLALGISYILKFFSLLTNKHNYFHFSLYKNYLSLYIFYLYVFQAYPQEQVGVFVRRGKGGPLSVLEYSEMDPAMTSEINQSTGRLRYCWSNV